MHIAIAIIANSHSHTNGKRFLAHFILNEATKRVPAKQKHKNGQSIYLMTANAFHFISFHFYEMMMKLNLSFGM